MKDIEIKKFADHAMWVSYAPTPGSTANGNTGISAALISWRSLLTDPAGVGFNVYKKEGETAEEIKLNATPIVNSTCWQDANLNKEMNNYYRVTIVGQNEEKEQIEETICDYTLTTEIAQTFYREIKLTTKESSDNKALILILTIIGNIQIINRLKNVKFTNRETYWLAIPNVPLASITYKADDVQVGDLDGDGEMEIVVKREPYDGANQGGWRSSGTTLLEAYEMDGTFLWQIDLGINIRSDSHYTSYALYDFDGDGRCEIAFRSSKGTRFANGKTITDKYGIVNDYRIRDDAGAGW